MTLKTQHSAAHRRSAQRRWWLATGLSTLLLLGFSSQLVKAQGQTAPAAPATAPVASEPPAIPQNPQEINITAIPPRLGDDGKLLLKPGEKVQVAVKVRNASGQTIRIDSNVSDFILDEDGETPVPVTDSTSNRWSLASWVVLSPTSQILEPNELGLVNVIIDVPADALPGGHYAMIVHRPSLDLNKKTGETAALDSAASVNQRVGTLVYGLVDGPINEEAFVTDFTFPKLTEYGPVPFSFTVENVSDIHITPRTTIEISDVLGRPVETLTVEPKNVFPLFKRDFSGTWEKVWGTGYYRAKLTMSFGASGKVVMANTSFWLLPYKLLALTAGILVILLVVIGGLYRFWYRRQRVVKAHLAELEKKVKELEHRQSN